MTHPLLPLSLSQADLHALSATVSRLSMLGLQRKMLYFEYRI